MLSALVRGFSCGVERESEERQSADFRQRRGRLSLRRHAAPIRLAAGNQNKVRNEFDCLDDGSPYGRLSDFRTIRSFRPLLHVGELIAEARDAALGKPVRNRCHERVRHAGPCSMGQHIADARREWREQEAGDLPLIVDCDAHGLRADRRHACGGRGRAPLCTVRVGKASTRAAHHLFQIVPSSCLQ